MFDWFWGIDKNVPFQVNLAVDIFGQSVQNLGYF